MFRSARVRESQYAGRCLVADAGFYPFFFFFLSLWGFSGQTEEGMNFNYEAVTGSPQIRDDIPKYITSSFGSGNERTEWDAPTQEFIAIEPIPRPL